MTTPNVYDEWHHHFNVGIYLEKEPLQGDELPDEVEVPVRHMSRWTNGEIDTLWSEFQIKRMMIQDIASQHQRTCASILYKLKSEGLLDWHGPLNCETITDIIDKANDLICNADYDEEEEDEDEDEDDEYVPVLSEEEEDDEEDEEEDEKEENRGKRHIVFENYKPDMMDYVLHAYVDGFHYAVMGATWTLNVFIEFLKFASSSNNL